MRYRLPLVLLLALVGALLAAPGQAADGGSLAGTLLDAGRPVAGAEVLLQTGRDPVQIATTGADGTFRADGLNPGSFYLIFALPAGGVRQWYPGRPDSSGAEAVTIAAGEVTTIAGSVAPYGTITGLVTFADGSPAPSAQVTVIDNPRAPVRVRTGPDGAYRVGYLPPGSYRLHLQASAGNAPDQVADHAVTVTAGSVTVADWPLQPLGTLSGRLTGDPAEVAGAGVAAETADADGVSVSGTTSADGRFRLFLPPGRYRLHFTPAGGIEQWARGSATAADGAVFAVADGQDVRVDEPLLATGTLAGRFADVDGGAVRAGTPIEAIDESSGQRRVTYTDSDGGWSLSALPGRYRVRASVVDRVQWWPRSSSPLDASPLLVRAGRTTTANDRLLPPGSLVVTAPASPTGFCVAVTNGYEYHQACTDSTALRLDGLSPYRFRLGTTAPGHLGATTTVRVRSGLVTRVRAALRPDAAVVATSRDASTGAAVPACVTVFALSSLLVDGPSACSEAGGPVTVRGLAAGRYVVFVQPTDEVHGSQWVGPAGGTGDRARARVVTVSTGGSVPLAVRVDPAGSITGTVTSAATGERLESVLVEVGAESARRAFTHDGTYELTGLGPYRWPLKFRSDPFGSQWSGRSGPLPAPSGAIPVRVPPGGRTTVDAALRPVASVTGTVIGDHGHRPDWAWVTAWDARSGEYLAAGSLEGGRYRLPVLGPNTVRLTYQAGFRDSSLASEGSISGTFTVLPGTASVPRNLTVPEVVAP